MSASSAAVAAAAAAAVDASLAGRRALVLGGTSGIGAAMGAHLAARGCGVVVAGRNRKAGEAVISRYAVAPTPHGFAQVDVCDLRNVRALAARVMRDERRLDMVVLSPGHGSMRGFTPTVDGLDAKLQVNIYSRAALLSWLAPLLVSTACGQISGGAGAADGGAAAAATKGRDEEDDAAAAAAAPAAVNDVRVVSVLSAGVHSEYADFRKDPDQSKNFRMSAAANHAGMYNDFMADALSKAHPEVTWMHCSPGFIKTNWGRGQITGFAGLALRAAQAFGRSPEACADYLCPPLYNAEFRGGGHRFYNQYGKEITKRLKLHTDENRDFVWQHIQEQFADIPEPDLDGGE